MADVERVQRIRHAHETNALNYGHLGTATYHDHLRSWSFLRQNQSETQLDLRDVTGLALDDNSGLQPGRSAVSTKSAFALVHEQTRTADPGSPNQTKSGGQEEVDASGEVEVSASTSLKQTMTGGKNTFLIQTPDAAFAVLDLRTTALPSLSLSVYGGNILAFGNAIPAFEYGVRNSSVRPIAAFAAGAAGETLRLAVLEACDVPIRNSSGLVEVHRLPAVSRHAGGYWTNSAEPILHLSVSAHQHRAQFLVVKSSGTSILQPRMIDNAHLLASTLEEFLDLSYTARSQFDPCPVITIPASRTGGNPQAHSAFNPQDQRALAVVDSHGLWSIWRLDGARARSARVLYRVQLESCNALGNVAHRSRSASDQQYYDGWHRVCWLTVGEGSIDRILVCNRRAAAVFEKSGMFVGLVDMRLGPLSDGNQILDIQKSDRQKDQVLVLTTSRLLIFSSSEVSWKDRSGIEPLALVCSWNHFRARNDLTLRMSLCEFPRVTCVLAYSSATPFSLIYCFGSDGNTPNTVSLKDPAAFEMPRQLRERMKHVSDIVLCPIKPTAAGDSATPAEIELVKLTACLTDGTIVEAVYKHRLGKQSATAEDDSKQIFSLSLTGTTGIRVQSAKYVDEDETDDFVVVDEIDEHLVAGNSKEPSQTASTSVHLPRFRHWEALLDYEILQNRGHASRPFEDVFFEAAQRIQGMRVQQNQYMHLLSDVLGPFRIADVEQDSEFVRSWLDELRNTQGVLVESNGHHLGRTACSLGDNLVGLYDDLTASYIESLPSTVTDRTRVNRERIVRQAAAEAFTSRVVLMIGSPEPEKSAVFDLQTSSPRLDSDHGGATSSQISASQSPLPEEEPAVARLRRYAQFQETVPPILLSRNAKVSDILAHLPDLIEDDPADYSYREITQRQKLAQEEMATQSLDPRERRKAARHAARLQRKLEKTAKMSQEVMMQRTVLPSIATGGVGVTLPGREVQSSQMAVPESSQTQEGIPGLSMTQPERGAFGTRPAKAKGKGKGKRRAGF